MLRFMLHHTEDQLEWDLQKSFGDSHSRPSRVLSTVLPSLPNRTVQIHLSLALVRMVNLT
jgi:hypothetical protein